MVGHYIFKLPDLDKSFVLPLNLWALAGLHIFKKRHRRPSIVLMTTMIPV